MILDHTNYEQVVHFHRLFDPELSFIKKMAASVSERWLAEKSEIISRTFDMSTFKLNRSKPAPATSPRKISIQWLIEKKTAIEKIYEPREEVFTETENPMERKIEQLGSRRRTNSASAA